MIQVEPVPLLRTPPPPAGPSGLGGLLGLDRGEERAFPLAGVRVRAWIVGAVCRTEVEQRFRNAGTTPMEAVHLFPVPERAAVVEAELRCGELSVRAECRRKEEAEATFAAAREAGHRAALLTREREDIHTLRVTSLPPGEEVVVRLVLVEVLDDVDGALRWRFPTTIAPRFMPGDAVGHDGPGVTADTEWVPDASRISPPVRLAGGTPLDLEVHIAGSPTEVACSLHAVRLGLGDGVRVAPTGRSTLDRDFVLAVRHAVEGRPSVRAWSDGSHTLVQVDPPRLAADPLPRDAVFVVDISGSMSGVKLDAARRAVQAALHGLTPADRFLLLAFDDRLERMSRDFLPVTDREVGRADAWVHALQARGGTVMLPAIQAALAGPPAPGRLRTVLFITDGQAGDEARLAAAVHHGRGAARFFTLGIDTAVNASLLRQLARLGGGTCELCTPHDDIEAVVAGLEARFGTPVATEVSVSGGSAARPEAATLFAGRPVTVLLEGRPERVEVTGLTHAGPLRLAAPVAPSPTALGALWARERVAWLEDRLTVAPHEDTALLPEIERVALGAGIPSRRTALVAVERTRATDGGRPVEVVQPHELPQDWDPGFRGAPGGAPGGPMLDLARASAPPPPAPSMAYGAPSAPVRKARPAKEEDGLFKRAKAALEERLVARRPAAPEPMVVEEAAAPAPAYEAAPPGMGDEPSRLARSQAADGSFGHDLRRTAAALLLLVLLGHTRSSGLRQRTVTRAAAWLAGRAEAPEARLVLDALAAAEAGQEPAARPEWRALADAGPEGSALRRLLDARGLADPDVG